MESKKKLIVITGASSGIGASTAKLFASLNYPLLLLARRVDKMKELNLPNSLCLKCDVTNYDEFSKCIQEGEKLYGPVDCLVNNAGYYKPNPDPTVQSLEEWNQTIDINCKGILHGIKAVLPGMKERRNGTIINISSIAGKKNLAGASLYVGSKFFVQAVTENMREEMASYNVRFSVIAPGTTFSEMLGEDFKKYNPLQPETISQCILFAYEQPQECCVREIIVGKTIVFAS